MTERKTFNDVSNIKSLGSGTTKYDYDEPTPDILETFKNTAIGRDYLIELKLPEFTSFCPKTRQPDFANFYIRYIPDLVCLESKSIKLYMGAFRNFGCFMESTVNKIIDDWVSVCAPKWIEVQGIFAPRGGITLNVYSEYVIEGYTVPADFRRVKSAQFCSFPRTDQD